jgi:hypothetical protein
LAAKIYQKRIFDPILSSKIDPLSNFELKNWSLIEFGSQQMFLGQILSYKIGP